MPNLHKPALRLSDITTAVLCVCLAACGGGGGSVASDPSTGASTTSSPSNGSTSSNAGSSASGSSSGSPAPAATVTASQQVSVVDAVGTARTLGTSALLSVGLPAMSAAPSLTLTPNRVFHVDSVNGADTNDGLAATATGSSGPWRTLARLMTAGLVPGDRIELACGGVWHETLSLPVDGAAGSPIVVAQPAGGCSTLPSIDGTLSLSPSLWTPYTGNIYKAPIASAPLALFSGTTGLVAAHFPNNADVTADPGSPYLSLAAASNGTVLTTGADFTLPAGASIDTTTQVHVRTNAYVIDQSAVAAFDGTHITLAQAPSYTVASGWGYFLTGQLWMLRSAGEWWYDPAAQLVYAWMPDSAAPSSAVTAATLATGINLQGRQHVVVDGIAVHGVGVGVDARGTSDVTLRNMLVEDIADLGIDVAGSHQDVVDSNGIARTGGDAVTGWGGAMGTLLNDAIGLIATNNVIRESGVMLNGDLVTSLPRRSLAALFTGSSAAASGNVIVDTGYIGILAEAGSTVSGNFVYGTCSVQDDCGAIYASGLNNGSQIIGNTIVHSRGALFGQPIGNRATSAGGVYIDGGGSDLLLQSNTVIDTDYGIQLHDAAQTTVQSNRLFANRRVQVWMQEDSNANVSSGDMVNNVVTGNEIAPISSGAVGLLLSSTFASTTNFGTFTANRFYDRIAPVVAADSSAQGSEALSFGAWSGSTGHGSTQAVDSQGFAVSTSGFATYTISGGNLVSNGAFQNGASGWSNWNATAPAGQATVASCPAGTCLEYAAGGSAGVLSSPGFAVQQGAWYRLTIDTSTQVDNQVVPLIVRIGSGSYASVSDRSLAFTASRAWSRHSVVFQATQTVTGTGARMDIDGIVAGQAINIAAFELVQITPDATSRNSAVVVNASATTMSAACPLSATQPALCSQLFDLATSQAVSWPLPVAARSAAILYAQNTALVDSDGDGIPDSQDTCPNTAPGTTVNASGCPLTTH